VSGSEPSAINLQIDGNTLKQFLPNKHGNIVCGTGNDSWYGKKEIDTCECNGQSAAKHLNGVQFID